MKKTLFSIFAFAALLSAAGCEKQETEPAEEPSIQLTQTSISVSNEENTINIGYRISNPVETGRINTESSVDWIHDLAEVDGNTTSAIVDANPEFSERTGKITVSYIYGEGLSVEAELTVTQSAAIPDPVLELGSLDPVSYKGGAMSLTYTLTNPVEGGIVEASSEENWITGFSYEDGVINFNVLESDVEEDRQATITVTYSYEGGSISAEAVLTQTAAPHYDYKYVLTEFYGFYLGTMDGYYQGHAFTLSFSDMPFREWGMEAPGSVIYSFEMYSEEPADTNNPLPVAGTYTIGESYASAPMTFSPDYSRASQTDEDYNTLFYVNFAGGTFEISYADNGDMVFEAVLTDTEGKTHHAQYTGPAIMTVF